MRGDLCCDDASAFADEDAGIFGPRREHRVTRRTPIWPDIALWNNIRALAFRRVGATNGLVLTDKQRSGTP